MTPAVRFWITIGCAVVLIADCVWCSWRAREFRNAQCAMGGILAVMIAFAVRFV